MDAKLKKRSAADAQVVRVAQRVAVQMFRLLTKARDPYENHHGFRTAEMAHAIGEAVGLDTDQLELLKIAAQIHDLGKLVVPEHVLNKTGRLTKAEITMIHSHTQLGYEIAGGLQLGKIIEDVIFHHHENQDGTGYPDELSGERISIHARIVHITDVYDALTNIRPYRIAYTPREAIAVLENESHKFDPHLLSLLRRKVTNWTTTLGR